MLRIHPSDDADLSWFWNIAPDEIGPIASTWPAEARARAEWVRADVGLRCGPVHVGSGAPYAAPGGVDGRAVAAATRFKRIARALADAGVEAELVLRLRYREPLPAARVVFGCVGAESTARSGRKGPMSIGRVLTPMRGPGSAAHLTKATLAAHGAARTTLGIAEWTDRLGQKLASGSATAGERELLPSIRREAETLVLESWKRYRAARRRVPDIVRRKANQRDSY